MKNFDTEMRMAKTMRKTASPEDAEYWTGYQRGLQRAHHGHDFGTPAEHRKWLALAESDDDMLRHRGRGYRDGLASLLSPAAYMGIVGGASRSASKIASARATAESRAEIAWTPLPGGRWRGERDGVIMEGVSKASLRLRIREALKKRGV